MTYVDGPRVDAYLDAVAPPALRRSRAPLVAAAPGWNGVTAEALFEQLNTALSAPARDC